MAFRESQILEFLHQANISPAKIRKVQAVINAYKEQRSPLANTLKVLAPGIEQ